MPLFVPNTQLLRYGQLCETRGEVLEESLIHGLSWREEGRRLARRKYNPSVHMSNAAR